jgi:hypothetical protein
MDLFLYHAPMLDENPLLRAELTAMLDVLQLAVVPPFNEYKDALYEDWTAKMFIIRMLKSLCE